MWYARGRTGKGIGERTTLQTACKTGLHQRTAWVSISGGEVNGDDLKSTLLCRLNLDVTWSETGDRYMLKLFRDYLFHTVTDDGRPWLDHAHILQCLNKLDAGTTEKVFVGSFIRYVDCSEHAINNLSGQPHVARRAIDSGGVLCRAQALSGASLFRIGVGSVKAGFKRLFIVEIYPPSITPPHFLCVQNRCC